MERIKDIFCYDVTLFSLVYYMMKSYNVDLDLRVNLRRQKADK